jgi:hypothetical protein
MDTDAADKLAEILTDAVNAHDKDMTSAEQVLAALMLVGNIISAIDCAECRKLSREMTTRELANVLKEAEQHAVRHPPQAGSHHVH